MPELGIETHLLPYFNPRFGIGQVDFEARTQFLNLFISPSLSFHPTSLPLFHLPHLKTQ
jgi:hypothetical protein